MQQPVKFTEKPALVALGDDAKAAGDLKDVAAVVYPDIAAKDPGKARDTLSDALRPNHARKLELDESIPLMVGAVEKQGRSAAVEHILSQLPKGSFDFRWVPKDEQIQRVTTKLSDMLPQFVEVFELAQKLMQGPRK